MGATTDQLRVDFLVGQDQLTGKFKQMNENIKRAERLGRMGTQGAYFGPDLTAVKKWANTEERINAVNKAMDRGARRASVFDFRMLSILFTGMLLQRTFTNMFNAIVSTFMKAENNTSALFQATNRLWASWEYLKFSIMDALDQPWIINLIDGIIKAIDWWSEFINKNEELGVAIMTTFGVFAVGGTIMIWLANLSMAWTQLFGTGGLLAGKLTSFATKAAGLLALTWSLVEAKDAYSDFKSGKFIDGILSSVSSALTGAGGFLMMSGNAKAGGALFAIGVAFTLVEQGTFFTSIYTVLGVLYGLAKGMGNVIVYAITSAFENSAVANFLRSIGWLKTGSLQTFSSVSDAFKGGFESGFKDMYFVGGYLDDKINKLKEEAQKSTQQTQPVQPVTPSYYQSGQPFSMINQQSINQLGQTLTDAINNSKIGQMSTPTYYGETTGYQSRDTSSVYNP